MTFKIGNVISYINDKNVFLSRSFKTVSTLSSPGNHLLQLCEKYISDYILYNNLDLHDVYLRYLHFISQYSTDLENFKKYGKYPFELNTNKNFDRISYDISLILSIFYSIPRFNIMNELFNVVQRFNGRTAIIGIGSGLELFIIKNAIKSIKNFDLYDLKLNAFITYKFPDCTNIIENEYDRKYGPYDQVLAIELLEHLSHPWKLIKEVSLSLNSGGKFIFTTATDMPQSDHLYNFNCMKKLQNRLEKCNLKILNNYDFYHNYLKGPNNSKNTWFECAFIN
tara:strand:+ start:1019 stop:1861 length:843 start_codon:yes stop_codon:yes gene_type:complete